VHPGFFLSLWRVYKKDTALEFRNPAGMIASLLFAFLLAVIYHYSMSEGAFSDRRNLNGLMLATLFFSSSLLAGRNLQFEKEGGAIRILVNSPVDTAGYYLGKVLALWQMLTFFSAIYIPVYNILLTGRIAGAQAVFFPLMYLSLSSLSLAALGILLSYLSSGNRLKDLILPLILLPAAIPVFILAVDALQDDGSAMIETGKHLIVLVAPGAIYASVGCWLYPHLAVEE